MTPNDLFAHLSLVGVASVFIAPALVRHSVATGIDTTICIVVAFSTLVLGLFAYLVAWLKHTPPRFTWREWFLQRGIIYALSQAPIAVILFRGVSFPVATVSALVSVFVLYVWITYRKRHSARPNEPIHHLHRYTLSALVPAAVFTAARIATATHVALGSDSLHALLYASGGLVLSVGYYVLFERHSLINAVLYVGLYIASIHCFIAPFSWSWHASIYSCYLAMAVVAFGTPIIVRRVWPHFRIDGRTSAVALSSRPATVPADS